MVSIIKLNVGSLGFDYTNCLAMKHEHIVGLALPLH